MTVPGLAYLILDLAIILVVACFWADRLAPAGEGRTYRWLLADLIFFSIIILVTTSLGYAGFFYPLCFTLGFLLALSATVFYARRKGFSLLGGSRRMMEDLDHWFAEWKKAPFLERVLVVALALLVLAAGLFAVSLEPVNYDSHHYRLPKIGHWFQEHSIRQYDTPVDPQNYLGFNAELLMAWVVGHFQEGYPLVRLVQWAAGLWILTSVFLMTRWLGFERPVRYLVMILILTAGIAGIEFSTTQTDLLAAAFLLNGFTILLAGRRRVVFAGLAWGIAVGVKGTVYFFGPGMVLVAGVFFLARQYSAKAVLQLCLGFVLSWACFAMPRHLENLERFDHPFASREWMKRHGADEKRMAALPAKFSSDSWAYLLQLVEPSGNPVFWQAAGKRLAHGMLGQLDESTGDAKDLLESRLKSLHPDADTTSIGLLLPLLFLLALLLALFRRRKDGSTWHVLVLGSGVLFFFLFFLFWHRWSYYAGRFFILAVPLMAVVAGNLFHRPGKSWVRDAALVLCAVWSLAYAFKIYTESYHTGLKILGKELTQPANLIAQGERMLVRSLQEPSLKTVAVALPNEAIYSGFYRISNGPTIRPIFAETLETFSTAEEFLKLGKQGEVGALVVPYTLVSERLGGVQVRVFQNLSPAPYDVKYLLLTLPGDATLPPNPFFIIKTIEYLPDRTIESFRLHNRLSGITRIELHNGSLIEHQVLLPGMVDGLTVIPPGETRQLSLEADVVQDLTFESFSIGSPNRQPPDPNFTITFLDASPLVHPFLGNP